MTRLRRALLTVAVVGAALSTQPLEVEAQRRGQSSVITVVIDGRTVFLASAALVGGQPLTPRSPAAGHKSVTFTVVPGSGSGYEDCDVSGGSCEGDVRVPDPAGGSSVTCYKLYEVLPTSWTPTSSGGSEEISIRYERMELDRECKAWAP
ncbi:MAG: hypothetical protein AAF389_11570 [Gemmatimonadota bacterium]